MAELSNAEKELHQIAEIYNHFKEEYELPHLWNDNEFVEEQIKNGGSETPSSYSKHDFAQIPNRLQALEKKKQKFQKKLKERDPVSGNPRYGEKTQLRVQQWLKKYGRLVTCCTDGGNQAPIQAETETSLKPVFHQVKELIDNQQLQQQKEEIERQEALEREILQKEQAIRDADERRKLEERRALEEQRRLEEERFRQFEEARQEERRLRELEEQRDREWMRSIRTGSDGVREQLRKLVQATSHDKAVQSNAITALHTIFSQIVRHPDQSNFRRIRRNHPKFNSDIGQYDGGKEFLIAAGFVTSVVDDVPSFVSKEPDLETELDKWSQWYDGLKETAGILEEALIQYT